MIEFPILSNVSKFSGRITGSPTTPDESALRVLTSNKYKDISNCKLENIKSLTWNKLFHNN